MGEQQQEAVASKSGSSSTLFSVVAVIAVGAAIAWLGWGDEIKSAFAPKPAPTSAPAQQAATPVEPEKPRPTVASPVSPKPLGTDKIGAFNFSGVYGWVIHYDERWSGVDQQRNFVPDTGYPRVEGNTWEMKAKWSPSGTPFDWHHTIQRLDAQTLSYDLSLKSDVGVQSNGLALGISLPIEMYSGQQIIVDGEPVKLPIDPATPATAAIVGDRTVNSLEIATPVGRIAFEGPITVMVQDNRAYNPNDQAYLIRINLTPGRGLVTESQLKMKVRQVLDTKASAATAAPSAEGPKAK